MMDYDDRPPPTGVEKDDGFLKERRFRLRRLTVRRRVERAGSDRRMSERRRPAVRGNAPPSWPF